MKALRFAASVLIPAAILALYRTLLPVNNTTVALTLLLAILGMPAGWGLAEATVAFADTRRCWGWLSNRADFSASEP